MTLRCPGQWRGLEVAIKTIIFQVGQASDQTATVAAEAAIASNLQHANIVATYSHDICQIAAPSMRNELALYKFFLIQEFCNGGSMAGMLDSGALKPQQLPRRWLPLTSLLRGTAAGMCHMHAKRICHGDLNPSNILFKVLTPLLRSYSYWFP
jgi:serine/threonine protein kinase